MLILSRKTGQSLIIGDDVEIKIVSIDGDNVKIGISAPKDVTVMRKELLEVKDENKKAINIDKSSLKKLEKIIKKRLK